MTIDGFIEALAQRVKSGDRLWMVNASGQMRAVSSGDTCPISSMAACGYVPASRYNHVAIALGLTVKDADIIADAADNHRTHNGQRRLVRDRLMSILEPIWRELNP